MATSSVLVVMLFALCIGPIALAQKGAQVLFGDVKIDDGKAGGATLTNVTIILYKDAVGEVGRQNVINGSRYRFSNLAEGDYELAIEVDNNEGARLRVSVRGLSNSPYGFQQDLEFTVKPKGEGSRPGVLSTADAYNRTSANKALFLKAQSAADKKKYDQALGFLKQILENDKLDFQAWVLLGTLYVLQDKPTEAEKAYLNAIELRPTYFLALIDLGKLRSSQKKFAEAIELLTRAVESQPNSAEANLFLGEAYLQIKKGSKAIPYLAAAAKLGRPEAHLRLALLYSAAGLKDKAATEYEEFLKKNPDYPERKQLEEYINANRKP